MTADKGETVLVGNRIYLFADSTLNTAAVNDDSALFELVGIFCYVINCYVGVKGNDNDVTVG